MADQLPEFENTVPATDESALPRFEDTQPMNPDIGISTGNENLPKFEDTVPAESSGESNKTDYESPKQQMITALEGAAQGATFGLSNKLETGLGFATDEEIAQREAANPGIHTLGQIGGTVASTFVPLGEGYLLAKAGSKLATKLIPMAENAGRWSKIGTTALQGLIRGGVETAGMQGGDELSKALIGKGNSADAVAMHIVGAGALGMCLGAVGGAGSGALKEAANTKLGEYLQGVSTGLGAAKEGRAQEFVNFMNEAGAPIPKGYDQGAKLYNYMEKKAASKALEGIGLVAGYEHGGLGGAAANEAMFKYLINPFTEKLVSKYVSQPLTKKVLAPVMLRVLEAGSSKGAQDALEYAAKAAAGEKAVGQAILATLKSTGVKGFSNLTDSATKDETDKLDGWINDGGVNQQLHEMDEEPQNFAKGGKVEAKPLTSGLGDLYPDQNIMLSTAKGRLSNYLTSLKPQNPIGMPAFDTPYKDKDKEKTYRNALGIAVKPLSVLKKVQNGTIKAEDVKHLTQMYPEVHDLLARKVTESVTQHQIDGEKPNNKTLQGLSLLLGTALKSEMTPNGIQAAQASFLSAQPQQQQAQGQTSKRGKKDSNLLEKIPKQYQTQEQARDARANKD